MTVRGRGYSLPEHTGDLRIRLRSPSLGALFEVAGKALFDHLAAARVRGSPVACVKLQAADREALLVDWLNELLYLRAVGGWLLGGFQIVIDNDGTSLRAEVSGERFDAARHPARSEIKAATFHGLHLRREGGEWRGDVILDL
jgi:SHS2 domain-containing protein